MTRFAKIGFPTFLFLLVFSFTSCVDEIKENQEDTKQAVEDVFLAQTSFTDGYDNMTASANEQEDLNGFDGEAEDRACVDVSFVTNGAAFWPAILSLDYANGCDVNGHTMKGVLSATFTGVLFQEGKSMVIDFNGYTVDDNELGGNYKLTNLGDNSNGQWQVEHKITDGSLTDVNGSTFTYVGTTTSTMVEGQETNWLTNGLDGILDDVWLEDDIATYVNSEGTIYNVKTLESRKRVVNCDFPVSGVMQISSESLNKPIEVDFGDGTCDRKISVSVGVLNFDMTL